MTFTPERLAKLEELARAVRPKVGSALYAGVLSLCDEVRRLQAVEARVLKLEAIRDAAEGLIADGDNRYVNRLVALLNAQSTKGG